MNTNPLVSLIIPIYNRANIVHETILSITNQTYTNWECIFVDDGSTDNTLEVLHRLTHSDLRFKTFNRPSSHQYGSNGARNYGFKLAKGEFINWIDSDDILSPDFIKLKIEAFLPEFDVVISKTVTTKENINEILGYEIRTNNSKYLLDDFLTLKVSWYVGDPMWRKSFLVNKTLFTEELLNGHDRDFHVRILLHNPSINFIPQYLYYYRMFSETTSKIFTEVVVLSILKVGIDRSEKLMNYRIKKETKLIVLKQYLKLYKYVYKNNEVLNMFFQLIKLHKIYDLKYLILIFKFLLSIISYKLFQKGEKILK